jgi:hypothetical protein
LRQTLLQQFCLISSNESDPLQLAAEMHNQDVVLLVDFIFSFVMDLLCLLLVSDSHPILNKDFLVQLTQLKAKVHLKKIMAYLDYLQLLRARLKQGIHLNKQLLLEGLFIRWHCL